MLKKLIIIPAYNESSNIEDTVAAIKKDAPDFDYVIINDGSADDTRKICARRGYNFMDLPVNVGLSGAIKSGMRYANYYGYDYVIQLDGDGQHDPIFIADMLEEMKIPNEASADGRGFSVGGGVAGAVVNCLKRLHPEREVQVERAEGLNDCRKMLMRAKAGKLNGYLLEGMACPGGCIGGAGTVQLIPKAAQEVDKIKKMSAKAHAYESTYTTVLPDLEE